MSKFLKRGDELERELRRNRPEPRTEFLAAMVERVGRERRSTTQRMRLGFAGALTAMILVSLAAFGGLSYAASAVESVAHVAVKVVTPSKPTVTHATQVTQAPLGSAAAQYKKKIKICHFDKQGKGHTEEIDESNFPSFRAHGDHKGECKKGGEFKPGSAAAKAAKKNGAGVLGTTRTGVNPSSTG